MMVGVKRNKNGCSLKQGGKNGKSSQKIALSMLPAPLG
jgi:hypothetical protein